MTDFGFAARQGSAGQGTARLGLAGHSRARQGKETK